MTSVNFTKGMPLNILIIYGKDQNFKMNLISVKARELVHRLIKCTDLG